MRSASFAVIVVGRHTKENITNVRRRFAGRFYDCLAAITDKPTVRPLPKVQVVSEVLLSPSFPRQGWSRPATEPDLRPEAGSSDLSSS